jgi:hypothetical protein
MHGETVKFGKVRNFFGKFSVCSISCNPLELFSVYEDTDGQTGWLNYLHALLREADNSIKRIYFRVIQEMVENYWMGMSLCVYVCVCVCERERERGGERERNSDR